MVNIYCIHCITSGKKYVGQTRQDVIKRYKQHMYNPYRGVHSHRMPRMRLALEKYGKDAFYVGLIEEVDDDKASERESYWINELESYSNGYNSTPTAHSIVHSPETRAKMSASHKARGTSNYKGKKRSPETIAKLKATIAKRKEMGLPVGCPKGNIPWNKKRD